MQLTCKSLTYWSSRTGHYSRPNSPSSDYELVTFVSDDRLFHFFVNERSPYRSTISDMLECLHRGDVVSVTFSTYFKSDGSLKLSIINISYCEN